MKSIITIIALLISCNLFAQKKLNSTDQIGTHITNGIAKYYHANPDSLKSFCRIGVVFSKFEVNSKGKIVNLAYNKRSPVFIMDALGHAIDSLRFDATLMSLLKKVGKPIIVPLIYVYQEGCNYPTVDLSSNVDKSKDFMSKYLDIYAKLDHTEEAMDFMLTFKDGSYSALDCILIRPCFIASGTIE